MGRMKELWQAQQEIRAIEEAARMEAADGTCKEHGRGWIRLDGSCARCTEERELKQRAETVKRAFPTVLGVPSVTLSDEEQLGRAAKHELEKRLKTVRTDKPLVEQLRECEDPLALEAAAHIDLLMSENKRAQERIETMQRAFSIADDMARRIRELAQLQVG